MATRGTGLPPRLYQPAIPHISGLFAQFLFRGHFCLFSGTLYPRSFSPPLPVGKVSPKKSPKKKVWALLGSRRGDNNQVLALAGALGLPFEEKHLSYNALRRVPPVLLGASFASVAPEAR